MASSHLHVADYSAALADGTFPGAFDADRLAYEFPAVESLNARGARLVWSARVRLLDAAGAELLFDPQFLKPGADAPEGVVGEITTESHQVSAAGVVGKTRAGGKPTIVSAGKNLGKANATNAATQALRDALSLYNAKVRRAPAGVAANAGAGAAAAAAPADAQPPPMLVKRLGETIDATLTAGDFIAGITAQRKFNGVRAPSYLRDGVAQMYSRTKNDYPGFAHIRRELEILLHDPPAIPGYLVRECATRKPLPDDTPMSLVEAASASEVANLPSYADAAVHVDGEIYKHGESLRWISGQARREDDEGDIDYIVYDCFFPDAKAAGHDMTSADRQRYLDLLFAKAAMRAAAGDVPALVHVKRAENFPVRSLEEAEALRDQFLAEQYEGAILRRNDRGYRYGLNNYHSSNLIKLKPIYDSEFTVVDFTEGTRGKDVGAVIWVCEVDEEHVTSAADKTFNVVPKDMKYEERYAVFRCLGEEVPDNRPGAAPGTRVTRFERDFRGQPLTVEYPERSTKTGKPTQAKALAFRTYEGGPADDPVRRLYTECLDGK